MFLSKTIILRHVRKDMKVLNTIVGKKSFETSIFMTIIKENNHHFSFEKKFSTTKLQVVKIKKMKNENILFKA